jgi:hypothetical protein
MKRQTSLLEEEGNPKIQYEIFKWVENEDELLTQAEYYLKHIDDL